MENERDTRGGNGGEAGSWKWEEKRGGEWVGWEAGGLDGGFSPPVGLFSTGILIPSRASLSLLDTHQAARGGPAGVVQGSGLLAGP